MGINSDLAITKGFGILTCILFVIFIVNFLSSFIFKKQTFIGKTKHWWGWLIGSFVSGILTALSFFIIK